MAKNTKRVATNDSGVANTKNDVPSVRPIIFGCSSIFAKDIEYLKIMALLNSLTKELPIDEVTSLIGCSNEHWLTYGSQKIGSEWKEVKKKRNRNFLAQFRTLIRPKAIEWQEGAYEFLTQLVANDRPRAVCYSGWQDTIEKFVETRLDLKKFFPKCSLGFKIPKGQSKPSPWAYEELARNFGVHPNALIVLENSEDGVRAAKSAGAYVIKISTGIPTCPDKSPFDELVNSFVDLSKSSSINQLMLS